MISKEEVQKLAELARLELTDTEVTSLQKDMSSILDYIGQLRRFEVGIPTQASGISGVKNVLRPDVPRAESDILSGKRDALLAALPKREGDYAVVRKIIQKDE